MEIGYPVRNDDIDDSLHYIDRMDLTPEHIKAWI
jgi:hypothetical protein